MDDAKGREQALKALQQAIDGLWPYVAHGFMCEIDKTDVCTCGGTEAKNRFNAALKVALTFPFPALQKAGAAQFILTLDEARALNYFIRLHHGLLRENEEQYIHILRLINGIGQFVDSHDKSNS